jgi:myo-inositol 2-dehydrogenase/D-chiro-inositol 1-dehydrogenase
MNSLTRRRLLQTSVAAGFPMIVPSRIFGRSAPSNQIHVAQIGCGRIAGSSELPGMLRHRDLCRIVAVCDVDRIRAADARQIVEEAYADHTAIKSCGDYRELLEDKRNKSTSDWVIAFGRIDPTMIRPI